jgi:hypothetical protein
MGAIYPRASMLASARVQAGIDPGRGPDLFVAMTRPRELLCFAMGGLIASGNSNA